MINIKNTMDKFKFITPCNILISGASQSGKTTWVIQLLKHSHLMFDNPPHQIFYCYKVYQSSFNKLNNHVKFIQGLPNIEEIADSKRRHVLVILDDLMTEANQDTVNLFVVQSHHYNISPIFILQNLFHSNKNIRTINLNSHYIISFRQSRDTSQIGVLARQIFGKNWQKVVEIYTDQMKKPYNYVLFNIHPSNINRATIHLNVIPSNNEYEILYTE